MNSSTDLISQKREKVESLMRQAGRWAPEYKGDLLRAPESVLDDLLAFYGSGAQYVY